jgi:hypothetical protein
MHRIRLGESRLSLSSEREDCKTYVSITKRTSNKPFTLIITTCAWPAMTRDIR